MKTKGFIDTFYHYAFPIQAILVTCQNTEKETNIITLAWHTPISKKPPLYGISIAPSRYSHTLIETSKEFIINFMPFECTKDIHFCGTHSGRKIEKVHQTNLQFEPSEVLKTPRIKQGFAHLECTLYNQYTLGDHTFFIGKVEHVSAESSSFNEKILDNISTKPAYYLGKNIYTTISDTIQSY